MIFLQTNINIHPIFNMSQFDLKWSTFTDHLREMLHNMRSSNELTDVTLVSDDKELFKAHKIILSASSPVFKSIINDSLLSNQIIYLRGIQSQEIESILQFIYLGQATLYQDRMNEFLNVAKSLEIKEVGKNVEEPEDIQLYEDFEKTDEMHKVADVESESEMHNNHQNELLLR